MRKVATILFRDYGLLLVLLALCAVCSLATIAEHQPAGAAAGRDLAASAAQKAGSGGTVLIVAQSGSVQQQFADALAAELASGNVVVFETVVGGPSDAAAALERAIAASKRIDVLACTPEAATWSVLETKRKKSPLLSEMEIVYPRRYYWPIFLTTGNLLTIVDQASVTAIMAIGMTMVIIGGGIDLSVGSLMALASVLTALLMRSAGFAAADPLMMFFLASFVAILACAAVGGVTGGLVTRFDVPPFIVTLAMLLIMAGLATKLADNATIGLPARVGWLGRERLLGIPNPVFLMAGLYAGAHLVMTRTVLGRWLYAVGGNEKAAHLCGISVSRVRMTTYIVSGALAGLGGVILTSTLTSGNYKLGAGYELIVISAVVVGGTSLSGGQGSMMGTLLGSLIIAVIRNAMNLAGLRGEDQPMVLGAVILGAVLLDRLKRGRENKG
ncbi:MAG TPA: ABC transporter permease [Pirellulaceae bacterium]|nr:ABC transporter permease [Pirellulaceae bacterium]